MQAMASMENRVHLKNDYHNGTDSGREGGDRMLQISVFAFTLTVARKQPRSRQTRYEDERRIKALREERLDRHFIYSRIIR